MTVLLPVAGQTRDGPPSIQHTVITDATGATLRDPLVERAEWRDPDDPNAHIRRSTRQGERDGARLISGWKRVWTIDSLAKTSPDHITPVLVKTATRFLNDVEQSLCAAQTAHTGNHVDNGSDAPGRMDAMIAAAIRVDEARTAVGAHGARVLMMAVVQNQKLTSIALYFRISRDRAFGLVLAALTRLREHYDDTRKRTRAPMAPLVEHGNEREGRWRT